MDNRFKYADRRYDDQRRYKLRNRRKLRHFERDMNRLENDRRVVSER